MDDNNNLLLPFLSEARLFFNFDKILNTSTAKGIDKKNTYDFEKGKISAVATCVKKINNKSFLFAPYLEVLKIKKRNKYPRMISIPTVRDRLVLYSIKDFLHFHFNEVINTKLPNTYIKDIKRFVQNSKEEELYYFKTDIQSFYDEINRSKLIGMLRKRVIDDYAIELIDKAISNPTVPYNYKKSERKRYESTKGVPQGLSISNILAQIYLTEFDKKFLDNKDFLFLRYVDDIILIGNQKDLGNIKSNIESDFEQLDLKISEEKTSQIVPLKNELTFLGYDINESSIKVNSANIERFIESIADKFTWLLKHERNKSDRPKWLEDNEVLKKVFIEELNERITGAVSKSKRYGWMFYFLESDDKKILYKIDSIINKFFNRSAFFDFKPPKELKKITKTYFEIKHKDNSTYIHNYDNYDTENKKRKLLINRGVIDPKDDSLDEIKINNLFNKYMNKNISKLNKDVSYNK